MNSIARTLLLLALSLAPATAKEPVSAYKTLADIPYRDGDSLTEGMKDRCNLDLYFPEGMAGFATIVWFHGGGLTGGSKSIPEPLKNQGVAVIAVNYRLSPAVPVAACIEDAAAATAWVFAHIAEYGGSPERIFVSGHSAGGYLTSMIGLDKHWLAAHAIDADRIAGLIPFSGHTITHFTVRKERGIKDTQAVVDDMAPLYHVRADAPPILLVTGDRELEMLGRYEENAYFWRMLKVAGHPLCDLKELQGYDHGGMAAPAFPLLLGFVRKIVAE